MAKLKSELELTCPCCGSTLVVDVNLGRIVSHREPRLSLHQRDAKGGWMTVEAVAGETVTLESIGSAVQVDDIYRDGLEDAR